MLVVLNYSVSVPQFVNNCSHQGNLKGESGGISCGSHPAITYGGELLYLCGFFHNKPVKHFRYACVAFLALTHIVHTFRLLRAKMGSKDILPRSH